MAGLTEKQWKEVSERLGKIDAMTGTTKETHDEIKDLTTAVNKLQVEVAEINIALFGINKNNGMNGAVKANTEAIKELKDKPGKVFKSWVPLFFCILFGLATIVGWAYNWVKDVVKSQSQITNQVAPTPDPTP